MNLTPVKTGDIIEADVRGTRFHGLVTEKGTGLVMVKPLNTTAFGVVRAVRARCVVAHYRKSKASR